MVYLLLQKLSRKNQAGGISASDFFYIWNAEQQSYFDDLTGRWQIRNNTKTGINTGLVVDETVLQDLAPFTIPITLTVSAGKASKPDDFFFRMALRADGKKVQFINPGQISYVNESVIDTPSIVNGKYYATEYEDYYLVLPSATPSIDLDYIATPEDVVWGYVFDADGRQIYSPLRSVQPKWANATIITITKRAFDNMGVSYKDADFTNFGRTAQVSGD
jgi:hypothetical protein